MKYKTLKLNTLKFFFLKKHNKNKKQLLSNFFFYNTTIINYLNLFIKKGEKYKIFNYFFSVFFSFFLFTNSSNIIYRYINEFQIYKTLVLEFLNVNFLMQWFTNFFNFFFFLNFWKPKKVKSKRKKLKQKNQPKYNISRYLISSKKKFKIIYKLFYFKIKFFKNNHFKNKFFKLLLDIILNLKESWLYKFKLNLYNFFLFLK